MSDEKKTVFLCPFKKATDKETIETGGKEITHERFEPCAGERCMAYCEADADAGIPPCCMLVESFR